MPCIYVAGNHEFYKGSIKEGLEDGRNAAAQFPNVHFLENDFVIIDGVRFLGATLWTDYRIEGHPELAMFHARERMNDYKLIAKQRNPWQRFVPETAYRMHQQSRRFIDTALKADPIKTVVVTHHLPHAKSIPSRFKGDLLNAAYASDLSDVIESGRPALWVHGHTHDSCDYQVGSTRVVCNPRGYEDENSAIRSRPCVASVTWPRARPNGSGCHCGEVHSRFEFIRWIVATVFWAIYRWNFHIGSGLPFIADG